MFQLLSTDADQQFVLEITSELIPVTVEVLLQNESFHHECILFFFHLNFASSLRQLEVSKILPTSVHPRGTCSATELSRSTKKELFEQPCCLLQMQTEGNKFNSLVNYYCCCLFSNVAFENSSLVCNIRFNYSDGERS